MSIATLAANEAALEYIRQLVCNQAAIALDASKDYLLESRLLPLARQHGFESIVELVGALRQRPHGKLHGQVVEAMATNETSFFRDTHPFHALRDDVLPRLIEARENRRTLTIWSGACSTGQEPYSIAILLAEYFPQLADWRVQIRASDLSQQVIDRATRGEYTQLEVSRGVPADLLTKYFERCSSGWQINTSIRQRVQFCRLNLVDRWPPMPMLDVVFLRNVLIYFTAESRRQILAKLKRHLAQDGALILGGTESTLGIDDGWERVCHGKTSTYRLARAAL
jgi:chemotaxis protein methyltransferase CheR